MYTATNGSLWLLWQQPGSQCYELRVHRQAGQPQSHCKAANSESEAEDRSDQTDIQKDHLGSRAQDRAGLGPADKRPGTRTKRSNGGPRCQEGENNSQCSLPVSGAIAHAGHSLKRLEMPSAQNHPRGKWSQGSSVMWEERRRVYSFLLA